MRLVKLAHTVPVKKKKKKQAHTKATRLIETQRKLVSPGSRVNQRAEFLPRNAREKGSLLNMCFILPVFCHVRPRFVQTVR